MRDYTLKDICNKSYMIFITFKTMSKPNFKNITRRIENDRRIYSKQGLS